MNSQGPACSKTQPRQGWFRITSLTGSVPLVTAMDGHTLGSGAGMTVVRHIEHPGATATALPQRFNVLTEAHEFFQKLE